MGVLPQDVPTYSDVEEHMLRTVAAGPSQEAGTMAQWRREVRTRLADIGTVSARTPHAVLENQLHRALAPSRTVAGLKLVTPAIGPTSFSTR